MSDFDPTTNRIPFGLLSKDEQTALEKWPHGFEFWWVDEWNSCAPSWDADTVYRGKPAPVVTSKWFNLYQFGLLGIPLNSREEADKTTDECSNSDRIAVLHIDTCNGVSTAHLEEI